MTITISSQSYEDLWQAEFAASRQLDPSDPLDLTWKVPAELGHGYEREIVWTEGIELAISDHRLHDTVLTAFETHRHSIQFGFLLSGHHKTRGETESAGLNWFCGSGLAAGGSMERSDQRLLEVNVHIAPNIYESFVAEVEGEVPAPLQPMFKTPDQPYYHRLQKITAPMQLALRQLLHCPYKGATKRMYLQGKVLELLAMMVEQELELQQGKSQPAPLELDQVDRIHQARTFLLQRLENPPSLLELARLVGLNDCTLKRGFKQVFGKTVFSYLHDYRLEQAQQLLASGEMQVAEVAEAIGFDSRSYFSTAFRKKFGVTPKTYQMQRRNSG